jgi:hypothetical protein
VTQSVEPAVVPGGSADADESRRPVSNCRVVVKPNVALLFGGMPVSLRPPRIGAGGGLFPPTCQPLGGVLMPVAWMPGGNV